MTQHHSEEDTGAEAPPEIAFLKRLVTALAFVMGFGMVAIVALLWIRLGAAPPPAPLPELPDSITLPDGMVAEAVTFARDWLVVVTETGEILLYDANGALRDRLQP